jgi:adenosylmethionine-8-amino-7-oxononanoate aminotransferase
MQYKTKAKAKAVDLAPKRQAKESALKAQVARRLHRQDTAHLVHGFVPLQAHQENGAKIFVRGSGVYLWDTEGKKYIDGLASLWNVHVGHGRKGIAKAAAEQMGKLAYAPTLIGPTSVPTVELAAKLVKLAPKSLTRVIFTSGGSESTETIIRLLRFYWKAKGKAERTKIVSLNMGYHGSSSGAAAITGIPTFYQSITPGLPGVCHMARPYCYRCELGKTYPSCQVACADELERIVEREGAETIAAFIAEPVQGVGGVIVPPPEWLPKIREICTRYGILMVADEVITGFGRTGSMFAVQQYGVTPDILSMAKGITSGYLPLGAVMFKEEIYQTLLNAGDDYAFWHGYTYTGHPAVCAAALANIEILEREKLVHQARQQGRYFLKQLRALLGLPIVGDVRGIGLVAAVEFVRNKETKELFPPELKVSRRVWQMALDKGLLCRPMADGVALCPPLIITQEQIDEIVNILREAIMEVAGEIEISEQ